MPIPFAILATMRQERKRARAIARLMWNVARGERRALRDLPRNLEMLRAFINGE